MEIAHLVLAIIGTILLSILTVIGIIDLWRFFRGFKNMTCCMDYKSFCKSMKRGDIIFVDEREGIVVPRVLETEDEVKYWLEKCTTRDFILYGVLREYDIKRNIEWYELPFSR